MYWPIFHFATFSRMLPLCSPFHKWQKQGTEQQNRSPGIEGSAFLRWLPQASGWSKDAACVLTRTGKCVDRLWDFTDLSPCVKMKRTCFSALSRDITSSHKIWMGGNGSPCSSPWDPQSLEAMLGSTQRHHHSEWGMDLEQFPLRMWLTEKVKPCSLSIPPDCSIQLGFSRNESLWEGNKGGQKNVFFSRVHCSWRHGCQWKGCISMAFGLIFPLWKGVECLYCGLTFQPSHNSHTVSPPNPRVLHP